MAVQARLDIKVIPFILAGQAVAQADAIIQQDAGRVADLVPFTLMAKVAATGKWAPFINEAAVDGTANPRGVYLGPTIAAADLVAGDVLDTPILTGSAVLIDKDELIIENSKLLTTVIGTATIDARQVQDQLAESGIYVEDTVAISGFEN